MPQANPAPIIELKNITKSFDEHVILKDINLAIQPGEFLTLLGPSGCGKTTLLRLISGFSEADSGQVLINGGDTLGISANKRPVHTVFQSYALFPHMTVFDNIAFGLRCKKTPKQEIHERVFEVLRLVKLEKLAYRQATRLSGGQQQRVAIARAIVNEPLALLLDEPLSSLDYRLRKTMQLELIQLQRKLGLTFIFVTHDQEEALSMSDRIVVMNEGEIEQIGTPREVYENPSNLTVAKFIGEVNIFFADVTSATRKTIEVSIDDKHLSLKNTHNFQAQDKIHIVVRPEDMRVTRAVEADVITENMFPGKVNEVIYKGSTVSLIVELDNKQLVTVEEFFNEDDEDLKHQLNEPVYLHWIPGWEVILPYES